jgi:hypothetical protein
MAELCDTRARGSSPLQVSFDFRHSGLGSARVSRVGFGVSSKQSFREARDRETRSPARGTARATRQSALPGRIVIARREPLATR